MSPVEVKPYGGYPRRSVVFTVPDSVPLDKVEHIAETIRHRLPDINFAVVNETIRITHVD